VSDTAPGSVGLVEKRSLVLRDHALECGATLPEVAVGYETYGKPTPAGDNAILICHHYSGTAHAAGRYAPEDELPGYWDGLIGPGKAFDTDRYYVIATDALGNINAYDPRVVTTGPASVDPATGRRYGTSFPQYTIRDMVQVQRRLLDALGIEHLVAVAGPSMGGEQALEWAVTYPELLDRAIAVISGPRSSPWLNMLFLSRIEEAITLDPAWRGGDYDPAHQPLAGLTLAFNIMTVQARGEAWANGYGRIPADPSRDPYRDRAARFTFQTELEALSATRTRLVDANQFLWLNRANMLHDLAHGYASEREAHARIRARLLLVNASSDLWFPPHQAQEFAAAVNAAGGQAGARTFATDGGHLAGLTETEGFAADIAAFLRT
jgi:homoserine O-acetyltransferase/O-succinyltransferase